MSLSNKIINIRTISERDLRTISIEDVREFIKELKKILTDGNYYGDNSFTKIFKKIDELAGEYLI